MATPWAASRCSATSKARRLRAGKARKTPTAKRFRAEASEKPLLGRECAGAARRDDLPRYEVLDPILEQRSSRASAGLGIVPPPGADAALIRRIRRASIATSTARRQALAVLRTSPKASAPAASAIAQRYREEPPSPDPKLRRFGGRRRRGWAEANSSAAGPAGRPAPSTPPEMSSGKNREERNGEPFAVAHPRRLPRLAART